MDPLSIAAGCASLVSTIGTLSLSIQGFVRTCREARQDLDKVSRELQSLQLVLRLIEDDATKEENPLSQDIGQHVLIIVLNCNSVILEIENCIAQYGQKRLKAKVTWATGGQGDVEKLRKGLEAHKSSLELALIVHSLALTKDIKADTTEIRNDTTTIKENTEQILQQIVRLEAQLPKDVATPNDYAIQRFLEDMTTHTEMALDTIIAGNDDDSTRAFSDIEETSEASVERKRSDGTLDTLNEPRPPNVSETKRAFNPPAKTSPGGDLTAWQEPPNQQSATSIKARKPVPYRLSKHLLPGSRRPSNNGAPSAQRRVPAVIEASENKGSDTGARVYTGPRPRVGPRQSARRPQVTPAPIRAPMPIKVPMPKGSDCDLTTSNESQLTSLLEDEGVPESSAATIRPLNSATLQKLPAQARRPPARPRPSMRRMNRPSQQTRRVAYPERITSKDEAIFAQMMVPAVMEASASKDSDTGARVYTGPKPQVAPRPQVGPAPIRAPMPKGSDGDLATSDEPQFPSLTSLDGVLPNAPIVRTRPGHGLVAPGEIRPQRPPKPVRITRRDLKRIPFESTSLVPPKDETSAP
ncbi:uncharacterized protein NECHADRAFT_86134 [Fusarium vanettenii 77-13-4]|uniref:Azaphilone pigments biosynthesis cluster protein L N-terminal domain-containing protein n=1 Tax=Fusarium vanettenii (strain ATCC MYA-4622 / CBS 123669 / FGSC 9596 / NRRL 45880 / 77-13-4) TaxID=660122 RepID=C7Z1F5_FUSV7|nr:uncharacterized protein NECHADRAFT_86134 [Fusarium vanettenii 77-13-4]EEU41994.1 hypothetical protein NECHADRAFT_86134 [Fusarium vanettenii 77-13-4]